MSRTIARCGQDLIDWQSLRDLCNQFFRCKLIEAACFSLIVRLLDWRGPSAILWRIRTLHINAVNRVRFARASSHVGNKSVKRIRPSLAYINPPASVVFVIGKIRVSAAIEHILPDFVFRTSGVSVADHAFVHFIATAATASAFTPHQGGCSNFFDDSAVTLASPIGQGKPSAAFPICCSRQNNPATKSFSRNVVQSCSCRSLYRMVCSHEMFLDLKGLLWLVVGRCWNTCQPRFILPFLAEGSNG